MMKIEKFNENELKNALLVELSWLEKELRYNSENGISLKTLQENIGISYDLIEKTTNLLVSENYLEIILNNEKSSSCLKFTQTARDYLTNMIKIPLKEISSLILQKTYDWYIRNNYQIDSQENSIIICLALGIENHEIVSNAIVNLLKQGLLKKWAITRDFVSFGITIEGVTFMEDFIEKMKNNNSINNTTNNNSKDFSKVFIVHGRDDLAKVETARFLEKLGLTPIILHEQANRGMTIIEKIEHYTDVNYGIVLYTPDDSGALKGEDPKARARQNVVFEHGYLIGKLKRENVCALVKDTVETPNDISGIVYITMDDKKAWQIEVAKELKNAGYKIDMNNI